MKISRLFAAVLVVLTCVFATDAAYAKGFGKKPKPTPEPEKSSAHFTIVSVSQSAISVKVGHDTKDYKIDGNTTITLDGTRVGTGALKAGMYADVTPSGISPGVAMSIEAKAPKSH